jgi:phage gp46-like protein
MEKNTAPLYDGSGYLQLDETFNMVLSSNDILSEVMERLRSRRGSYIFDRTYGSDLYLLLNSRNISVGQISAWVRDALQPMINNGRIQNNLKIIPLKIGNVVKISIAFTADDGVQVTAIFSSFLLV